MTYLKMPLQLQSAVAKKLQRCSYQESIAQHIMLLILSHHGEVIGREDFGSMIWDLEFNQLVKISDWEEGVKNSLIKTIEKYEKRLRNVDVNVSTWQLIPWKVRHRWRQFKQNKKPDYPQRLYHNA